MKIFIPKLKKYVLIIATILLSFDISAQTPFSDYKMEFQYRNTNNVLIDTVVSRFAFKKWSNSATYPDYVKWKNQPFAVLHSALNGVGLFTDSLTTFAQGQEIGFAFIKIQDTQHFSIDYVETNAGSFINDDVSPNVNIELTPLGLKLRANVAIPPNTELTVSYQALIDLFQGDPEVVQAIKYW